MKYIYGNIQPSDLDVEMNPETGVFFVTNGAWEGRLIDFKRGHEGPYVLEMTDRAAPNRGDKWPGCTFVERVMPPIEPDNEVDADIPY